MLGGGYWEKQLELKAFQEPGSNLVQSNPSKKFLVMGDKEPEPAIFCNETRFQVEGL